MKPRLLLFGTMAAGTLWGSSAMATLNISASALTGPFGGSPSYSGNPTAAQIATALGISNAGSEMYKAEPGPSAATEDNTLTGAPYYTTVYNPLPAADAINGTVTITWDGPSAIVATALVIKDGSFGHYAYNLAGWNGTDTIVVQNPYPGQGTISHISLYGTRVTTVVPEPSTYIAGALAVIPLVVSIRRAVGRR